MIEMIHGGDIYRNRVCLDFSVNVNPLGMPKEVERALHDAVEQSGKYPDINAEKLRKSVGNMLGVPEEYLLFGNGASELFMAIAHGIRPRRTVIPIPSFYGYEYAAEAVCNDICYYMTNKEDDFRLKEDFLEILTENVDLLFLANPNNPTGILHDSEYLHQLLVHCKEKGICVVLDECFVDFCGEEHSMMAQIQQFDHLILVRAFTKIYAIPGVRLGFLVCSNQKLLNKIKRQLPEWNLSVFAQKAGCVCAQQKAFVKETADFVRQERAFLTEELQKLKVTVLGGEADFILLFSELPLYERLLKQGILIRNCENFKGLSEGYYRIAVRDREENLVLLKAIEKVLETA